MKNTSNGSGYKRQIRESPAHLFFVVLLVLKYLLDGLELHLDQMTLQVHRLNLTLRAGSSY